MGSLAGRLGSRGGGGAGGVWRRLSSWHKSINTPQANSNTGGLLAPVSQSGGSEAVEILLSVIDGHASAGSMFFIFSHQDGYCQRDISQGRYSLI